MKRTALCLLLAALLSAGAIARPDVSSCCRRSRRRRKAAVHACVACQFSTTLMCLQQPPVVPSRLLCCGWRCPHPPSSPLSPCLQAVAAGAEGDPAPRLPRRLLTGGSTQPQRSGRRLRLLNCLDLGHRTNDPRECCSCYATPEGPPQFYYKLVCHPVPLYDGQYYNRVRDDAADAVGPATGDGFVDAVKPCGAKGETARGPEACCSGSATPMGPTGPCWFICS